MSKRPVFQIHFLTRCIIELNPYVREYFGQGFPVVQAEMPSSIKVVGVTVLNVRLHCVLKLEVATVSFWRGWLVFPEKNWLGIEIRYKRVIMVAKKLEIAEVHNARILRYDNWCLDDLFEKGVLEAVYCNHPDPWSKKRQRFTNEYYQDRLPTGWRGL